MPCCCSRANGSVHIEARTNDGAVSYPTPHFKGHTARGANARKATFLVQGQLPNGVVVFNINDGLVVRFFAPLLPFPLGIWDHQILERKAHFLGKLTRAFSYEHDVRCLFHHGPSERTHMHHIFHRGHRTNVAQVVHAARIQGHKAVAVRSPAQAYRTLLGIRLTELHPGFRGIQSRTTRR